MMCKIERKQAEDANFCRLPLLGAAALSTPAMGNRGLVFGGSHEFSEFQIRLLLNLGAGQSEGERM